MRAERAAGIRKIIGGDGALPSNKTVVCRVSTKHAGCIHSLALADTNARFASRYSLLTTHYSLLTTGYSLLNGRCRNSILR